MIETSLLNSAIHGDCLEVLKQLPDNSIDSVVTDPPYGIKFFRHKWDYDVPSVDFWREVLRVVKPGAFIAVACGTRTYHRMAVNIEDAGFEIKDSIVYVFESNKNAENFYESLNDEQKKAFLQIMDDLNLATGTALWAYASGFPKSSNIAKAIKRKAKGDSTLIDADNINQWQGYGTALKPAVELFVLAKKPISEPNIPANVLKWHTGALNIDACKIETAGDDENGRYPANLIHDGSNEVLDLFKKAGYSKSKSHDGDGEKIDTRGVGWGFRRLPGGFNDEGTADRFFYCAKVTTKERNEGLKQHKNHHPTVKPLSLMRYIVRLVTPKGGVVLDPFAGSGTTGVACVLDGYNFICIEKEKQYADVANERIEYYKSTNLFYGGGSSGVF